MEQQYDFSGLSYEYVRHDEALPFKTFFTSIGYRGFHWHREFELILVLEGDVILATGGGQVHLGTDGLLLLNPFEPHGLVRGNLRNLLLVLQIDPACASGVTADIATTSFSCNSSVPGREGPCAELRRDMALIMTEMDGERSGHEFACMERVFSILKVLVRDFPSAVRERAAVDQRKENLGRLERILRFLDANATRPVRLREAADVVHLSPWYVSHLVKECTGLSFQQNLGMVRLHHAIHLMLTTDGSLMDIAFEAGFSDMKYLNKYFRESFGTVPSALHSADQRKRLITSRMHDRDLRQGDLLALLGRYAAAPAVPVQPARPETTPPPQVDNLARGGTGGRDAAGHGGAAAREA